MYGSQTNFARLCSMKDDRLSKIIRGKIDPNEQEKQLIASRLGVDYVSDLFIQQNS